MISSRTSSPESSSPVRLANTNSGVAPASTDPSSMTNTPVDVVALSQEAIGRITMPTKEVPEYLKAIIETIDKKDPNVTCLKLYNKGLTTHDIIIICKHLEHNPHITHLYVGSNDIGDAGAIALAKNTAITRLDAFGNNIDDAGAIALAQNTTITRLDIGKNKIHDDGAMALAENTTIYYLYAKENKFSGAAAIALNQRVYRGPAVVE
ncbi:MAG: hypothetical protein V4485_02240 [Pseudomonadota bacterium]